MSQTKTAEGVRYRPAHEVAEVAGPIMDEWHEDLCEVPVRFMFRSKTPTKGGREVWGTAKVVKGVNAYLALGPNPPDEGAGPGEADFFLITIAEPVWEALGPDARRALVDHELSHCHVLRPEGDEDDSEGGYVLRTKGHDLEEFVGVVARYGFWRGDVQAFAHQVLDVAANGFGVDLRGDQ